MAESNCKKNPNEELVLQAVISPRKKVTKAASSLPAAGLYPAFTSLFAIAACALIGGHSEAYAQAVPTIGCTTNGAIFNTAYNGDNGPPLASGQDPRWDVAVTTTSVSGAPPAGLSYGNASVVSNPHSAWIVSPFGNAQWIAHNSTGSHTVDYH